MAACSGFLPVAEGLLAGLWTPGTCVRLLGVGVSGFEPVYLQMGLEEDGDVEDERRRALTTSLDEVRGRYGEDVVRFGVEERGRALRIHEDDSGTRGTPGTRSDP